MKKIMFACAALLGVAVSLGEKKSDKQYPAVFWSASRLKGFSERQEKVEHATIASSVKDLVFGNAEESDAQRVYVIRKEGMTTYDFFRIARYLDYDRSVMLNHSLAFSEVGENGFDLTGESALEEAFGGVKASQYTLEAEAEIPVLAQTLAEQTDKNLQIYLINVKSTIGNDKINEISREIQEAAKANGVAQYVMGIVGVKSENVGAPHLSLQQTKSVQLPATDRLDTSKKATDNSNIKYYLYPNTLSGILIMLFIAVIMIIGFLQLMAVQTPTYFPTDKIDFGKIEK